MNIEKHLGLADLADRDGNITVVDAHDFGAFSVQLIDETCPTTNLTTQRILVNGINGKSAVITPPLAA